MSSFVLLLLLSSVDGRGEPPTPASLSARQERRSRTAFTLGGTAGFSDSATAAGPGFSLEGGAVFNDDVSVVARATIGTTFFNSALMGAVAVDFALSDLVSVGTGLGLGYLGTFDVNYPSVLIAVLPLRLHLAPSPRSPPAVRRTGLIFFIEVSPGLTVFAAPGVVLPSSSPPPLRSPLAICLAIGVGYAVW